MNPKLTIASLDELQRLGFTDEAFWRIHHFREKNNKETISGFRSYCETTDSFRNGGNNERVQKRIEMVLTNYRAYHTGKPAVFTRLADAAYSMIPAVPY